MTHKQFIAEQRREKQYEREDEKECLAEGHRRREEKQKPGN